MAVEIELEGHSKHRCYDELPLTKGARDSSFFSIDYSRKQPIGQIVRCSCGRLWKTVKWVHNGWSQWKRAGPILIIKCWGKGYENQKRMV